ncbi:MAG: type II secretion system protein J [Bdellovibrionales bacterium]
MSRSGFSLLELIVSGAIASVVLLAGATALQHGNQARVYVESKAEFQDQMTELRRLLRDNATCRVNFKSLRQDLNLDKDGVQLNTLFKLKGLDVNGIEIKGDPAVSAGDTKSGLQIEKIKLVPVKELSDSRVYSELRLTAKAGTALPTKSIGLLLKTAGSKVTDCVQVGGGAAISEQDICDLIGAKYDPLENKCVIPKEYHCLPIGGASNPASCPAGFAASQADGNNAFCWYDFPQSGDPLYPALEAVVPPRIILYPDGSSSTQFPQLVGDFNSGGLTCTADYLDQLMPDPGAYGVSYYILCVPLDPKTPVPANCHDAAHLD